MFEIYKLVTRWGYKEGSYMVWTKIIEVYELFQLRKDNDAYDFATYASSSQVDGDIYLEYEVTDIKLKVRAPQFINEMKNIEAIDDEGV